MGPMCCWLSNAYRAVGMLFLFDMLLLNGSYDANKQVPWRYIQRGSNMTRTYAACLHTNQSQSYLNHLVQPCNLAQHTVGNHGQLFLDSGLKSQFADVPEVAFSFLIVTEVVEGWLLWFISWDAVMVCVIWMAMNITTLKSYLFHERFDNCIILN